MSDTNLPTVGQAATRLAALFRLGNVPESDEEAEARMRLAASKIAKEIRTSMSTTPVGLSPEYAGHLVGLLLSYGTHDGRAVERLARSIREAIYTTPNLTAEDRAALAQLVLAKVYEQGEIL